MFTADLLKGELGKLENLVNSFIELSVTAGIGIATYPADALTALELLRCADIAMYRAKQDLAPYCRYTQGLDNFTSGALAMLRYTISGSSRGEPRNWTNSPE